MLHEELTGKIIAAFYKVYNTLGHGFLEKVYENALALELKRLQLQAEQQRKVDVYYEETRVGEYYADIIVNNLVVLELKTAEGIAPEHEAQLLNYLKATNIEVGLLLNFGPKPQFIRRIFTNDKKINHG
ncbi:MAG: GxxExxY protein [Bacteroidetes bacterium]|nr:MAG: GxxExxY protein [Bacteroidota bacterium]